MKLSEKIEIVGTFLAILAIVSLFHSSSLDSIAILMAVRLVFKYSNLRKSTVTEDHVKNLLCTSDEIKSTYGIVTLVDGACSLAVGLILLFLPGMILYLVTPYQTFNFIVGAILGLALITAWQSRILKLSRIWVWFITLNLALAFIIAIKALTR